jgi:hypothetical protein
MKYYKNIARYLRSNRVEIVKFQVIKTDFYWYFFANFVKSTTNYKLFSGKNRKEKTHIPNFSAKNRLKNMVSC